MLYKSTKIETKELSSFEKNTINKITDCIGISIKLDNMQGAYYVDQDNKEHVILINKSLDNSDLLKNLDEIWNGFYLSGDICLRRYMLEKGFKKSLSINTDSIDYITVASLLIAAMMGCNNLSVLSIILDLYYSNQA